MVTMYFDNFFFRASLTCENRSYRFGQSLYTVLLIHKFIFSLSSVKKHYLNIQRAVVYACMFVLVSVYERERTEKAIRRLTVKVTTRVLEISETCAHLRTATTCSGIRVSFSILARLITIVCA